MHVIWDIRVERSFTIILQRFCQFLRLSKVFRSLESNSDQIFRGLALGCTLHCFKPKVLLTLSYPDFEKSHLELSQTSSYPDPKLSQP